MDLRSDLRQTLSPVLNLTVDIKEYFLDYACMGGWFTELTVSYGDAVLGRGAVPWFCVLRMMEDEVAVQARGVDVVVPRFLRERLAGELERGEAVLDVTMTDPMLYGSVIACKAKIGGGPCHCKLE
ncbi:hypothetical protein ZWY2020_050338 [Hordeum vulgare]|nr:hypothetical protein ZWY2020_050338 [Hordeum vulgare]